MRKWLVTLLLGALLALRVAIVIAWHQPAGDGVQYYRIAEELRHANRIAFAPDPAPLAFSRLPGYPLFLAYVAMPVRAGVSLEAHVMAATLWNVGFDVATALLVFLTARALGLRRAWLAGVCILCWPTLWLMSSYALAESISTLALTAQLYLAVTIMRSARPRHAVAAGVIAGLAQLVRVDALCAIPMVLYACWRASPSRRIQLRLAALYLGCAAAVFAPWPIRNCLRFGAPHFGAATWRAVDGTPLPDGPLQWMRTWADSADGDSYFELMLTNRHPITRGIEPKQYDDEVEHQRLLAILNDYNSYGPIDQVDREFAALAKDRFRRHPLRILFVLPAKRIAHLFVGEPQYFMPMRIRWLGLPRLRPAFGILDAMIFILALAGCVLGRRSRHRDLIPLLLAPILVRFLICGFAIPYGTTERYLVEAFPIILLLAFIGVTSARTTAP